MVKRRAWRCLRWECSRKGAGGWRVRLGVNASSYHTVLCMHLPTSFRIYNGKAIVNSVNGEQKVMQRIFPIVKKYGAVVVGLTLDESGIPQHAEDRFAIAKKL